MKPYYVYLETEAQFKYFLARVKAKYLWAPNDALYINDIFVLIGENGEFQLVAGKPEHYLSFDEWKLLNGMG